MLQAPLRRRIRHIHLPDHPPRYAGRRAPGNLRDQLETQILRQRALPRVPLASREDVRPWLECASPPPTVLSFTGRPAYVVPKHRVQDEAAKQTWREKLGQPQRLEFPMPVGTLASEWGPFGTKTTEQQSAQLSTEWRPGVLFMPARDAFYYGPGTLSIQPTIDLQDHFQRGSGDHHFFQSKFAYERLLEDVTVKVLQREYGLQAFTVAGSTGVYVRSAIPNNNTNNTSSNDRSSATVRRRYMAAGTRCIATVHADIVNDITRWGICIHVGHPASPHDAFGVKDTPWQRLDQDDSVTSIAAELTYRNQQQQQQQEEHTTDKPPTSLRPIKMHNSIVGSHGSSKMGPVPYSMFEVEHAPNEKTMVPVALGMYNRDLATAWVVEFARQLGLQEDQGRVDFYKHLPAIEGPRLDDGKQLMEDLESSLSGPAWHSKPVGGGDDGALFPHQKSAITRLGPGQYSNDWDFLWDSYTSILAKFLDQSIGGLDQDTRKDGV